MPKKNNKNRNKNKQQTEEPVNKGRRNFLKLAGAGMLAAGAAAYLGYNPFSSDEWAFLERDSKDLNLEEIHWKEIEKRYIPFGSPDYPLPGDSIDAKQVAESVESAVNKEIQKRGYDKDGNYNIFASETLYGVPSSSRFSKSAVEYFKKAVDFLYKQLQSLDRYDIRFAAIKYGEDYTKDYQNTVFIGDGWHAVQKFDIVNLKNPKQRIELKGSVKHMGAFTKTKVSEKTGSLEEWFSFIGAYRVALMAPFSEIIPLTTIKSTMKYDLENKEIDQAAAVIADETICEGLSHVLSKQIIKELNIPDGLKHLEILDNNSFDKPMYSHVPDAIKWIQKNGARKAFDVYMESQKKFMELIRSS